MSEEEKNKNNQGDQNDQGEKKDEPVAPINPFETPATFPAKKKEVENAPKEEQPDEPSEEAVEAVEVVDLGEAEDTPSAIEVQDNLANAEGEDMSSEFWDILEQAGISRKKFFTIIIGIFLLIFGVLGFFLGWFDFSGVDFGDDGPIVVEEGGAENDNAVISPAFSVISSYIFGLEHSKDADSLIVPIGGYSDDGAIDTGLALGLDDAIPKEQYSKYMNTLSDLRNIFNTDVYDYLDKSTNRSEKLEEFIVEMANLNQQGLAIYNQLGSDVEVLAANLEVAKIQRDLMEAEFFRMLSLLEGDASLRVFDKFLVLENRATEIKARLGAYQALRSMFKTVLELSIPRLEDVKANKDALIEGVRVFDIPGSDINAIIPLPLEIQ